MASPPNPEPFKTVAVKLGLLTKAKAEQAHRLQIHVAQTLDLPKDFLEICEQKGMLSAEQIKKVREEVARRAAKASGSRNEVTKEKLRELAGFEILEKIGQGAMGAVFKVRQKSLDRIVALKILPPSLAKNKQFVERFVREARASAALNHPNIVQGIDVGEDKGVNYFAMEYIDGETVHERFKREGPLPVKDVLEIGRQTALALAHAHTRNLIHRDIKPANLMLLKPGSASQGLTVKVMDLGLARALEDEDGHRTEAGSALGTPFYLSPEQARGESNLSGACDLYCLGGTLYHLLTGKPPYEGESSAVIMTKHIGEPVPDPKKLRADLEPEVCEIVRKLMAKKPEERYPNAQALADDLGLVLAGDTPKHIKLKGLRGKSTGPVGAVTGKHGTTGPRGRVTTKGAGAVGPRKRDGEGETGPRTASASKSFPVLPVAVGGVALLALLGVLLSSSSGKPADPAKSSPDQASTENRTDTQPAPNPEGAEKQRQLEERRQAEAEAQRKLDELKSKAEQVAAGDLEALELAWSELRRSAGDHAYAKLANDKLKEIGELKAAAAAKAVERLIGEAGALAGQGDFDAALAHLAAADGKLAGNGELKAALDNAAQELAARGQEAGAKPLQAAADLAAAGKLEEAVGAYEAASRFKYQPVAKEAAAKLEAVRGQIAQAQAAAAEAARQKLFGLAKSVAELVRQRKTDEAQAEVRRALNDAELRPAQELLRLLPEAFDGVADLNRMAAARLVGHEEKGLVFPENDRVYYKIENERLYYRPKPDFPQVTNTRLDGVEWPDLLFLAGLRGGDVMAVLNAVPLERAEMLGGFLALLGETEKAQALFERGLQHGTDAAKERLKLWPPLLAALSPDPNERKAQELLARLKEQVAAKQWGEARQALEALNAPPLKTTTVALGGRAWLEEVEKQLAAAQPAQPARLTGLAKAFRGKLEELGGGAFRVSYDWSDPAQLDDFPIRIGAAPKIVASRLFFQGDPENRGILYHFASWRPPLKVSVVANTSLDAVVLANCEPKQVDIQEAWRNGMTFDVGKKDLARIFRLGTEVWQVPYKIPADRGAISIEVTFDGREWRLAVEGQERIKYADENPPDPAKFNKFGLANFMDTSYTQVSFSGTLPEAWIAQASRDPDSVRGPVGGAAVASNPPPGPQNNPPPPPKRKVKLTKNLIVMGNLRWQDSKIILNQGDQVEIVAKGQWNQGGAMAPCGPEGYKQRLGEYPAMCLLAKRGGADGGQFEVGANWNGPWEETGKLFFQANDNDSAFKDNIGFVNVTVTVYEP